MRRDPPGSDVGEPRQRLAQSIRRADARILDFAEADPTYKHIGTTIAAMAVAGRWRSRRGGSRGRQPCLSGELE